MALVCAVSDNFKVYLRRVGSLNLIVDTVKLPSEPVFGRGVKRLIKIAGDLIKIDPNHSRKFWKVQWQLFTKKR